MGQQTEEEGERHNNNFIVETETVNTSTANLLLHNNNSNDDTTANSNTNFIDNIPSTNPKNINTNNNTIISHLPPPSILSGNDISTIRSNLLNSPVMNKTLSNDVEIQDNKDCDNNNILTNNDNANFDRGMVRNVSEPAFENSFNLHNSNEFSARNTPPPQLVNKQENINLCTTNNSLNLPNRSNSNNITIQNHRSSITHLDAKNQSTNSLIDNNPLPIPAHTSQTSLKNKKSTLLVESNSVNDNIIDELLTNNQSISSSRVKHNTMLGSNINKLENKESLSSKEKIKKLGKKTTLHISSSLKARETPLDQNSNKHQFNEYILNNNNEDIEIMPRDSTDYERMERSNSIRNNIPINSRIVSKIIERPPIISNNSRDLLLNDKNGIQKKESIEHSNLLVNESKLQLNIEDKREQNDPARYDEKKTIESIDVHHDGTDQSQKPNKTDFFAARLASAVGENEISDSEETFVYESAANSTKNMIYPSSSNMALSTNQGNLNESQIVDQNNTLHGVAPKMSVPLLNNNKKLLSRLKNTRHISTGGILTHSTQQAPSNHSQIPFINTKAQPGNIQPNITSSLNTQINPDNITSSSFQSNTNINKDDISSIASAQKQDKQNDLQSVKSFVLEQHSRSPEKRMSTISLNKNNNKGAPIDSVHRHSHLSQISNSHQNRRSDGKRVLRTTVSKIFDTNGTPLRRYSGVPDNVNLEDYIEQSDDTSVQNNGGANEYCKNGSSIFYNNNSVINGLNGNKASTYFHPNSVRVNSYMEPDQRHAQSGLDNIYQENGPVAIEEEEEEDYGNNNNGDYNNTDNKLFQSSNRVHDDTINNDDTGDDVHSMFYYNHRSDLEARPPISDYEDDEEVDSEEVVLDNNIHGPAYYHTQDTLGDQSQYSHTINTNYVGDRTGYIEPFNEDPETVLDEQTPLRYYNNNVARNRLPRTQIGFSPHNFATRKSNWAKFKNCLYLTIVVASLLTTGFLFGFILATNKELQNFDIVLLDNVISSVDELIFDITASAFNPGLFSILISTVQLDIFAKSREILDNEALLLGSINNLEPPLEFDGGVFNRRYSLSMTTLKMLNPGSNRDSDENSKWKKMIRNNYQLVLRGTMKYNVPFFNNEKTIVIQKTANISVSDGGGGKGDYDYTGSVSLL